MISKIVLLAGLVLIGAFLSTYALASTNNGIDTPTGVTTLPLAVEGNSVINLTDQPSTGATVNGTLTTTGNVGIGVAPSSAAPLDVGGGILGSSSSVKVGSSCSPEGMLGYDLVTSGAHKPVYCSESGVWTSLNPPALYEFKLQSTSGSCLADLANPPCDAGYHPAPGVGSNGYPYTEADWNCGGQTCCMELCISP
jgi:hypothetical protein